MKTLLLFSFIFSTQVWACPDLAGNFKLCRNKFGKTTEKDIVMIQENSTEGMKYSYTSTDIRTHDRSTNIFIANGKPVVSDQDGVEVSIKTVCEGQVLNIKTTATHNETILAIVSANLTKTATGLLNIKLNKMTLTENGQILESDSITCE